MPSDSTEIKLLVQMATQIGEMQVSVAAIQEKQKLELEEHAAMKETLRDLRERLNNVPDDLHHKHHDWLDAHIALLKSQQKARESIVVALAEKGIWAAIVLFAGLAAYGAWAKFIGK